MSEGGHLKPSDQSWDAKDQKTLDEVIKGDSKDFDFDNLFKEWGQNNQKNCATVATIKHAQDVYDNRVFDQTTGKDDGSYDISMQDGYKLNVTQDDLKLGEKLNGFGGEDGPAKAYANLLYTAAAKRGLQEGKVEIDGATNLAGAMGALNDGELPIDVAHWMGLEKQIEQIGTSKLDQTGRKDLLSDQAAEAGTKTKDGSLVAWNHSHAVYADRDKKTEELKSDHYGEQKNYDGTDTNGGRLIYAMRFKPRPNGNTGVDPGTPSKAAASQQTSSGSTSNQVGAPSRSSSRAPSSPGSSSPSPGSSRRSATGGNRGTPAGNRRTSSPSRSSARSTAAPRTPSTARK